MLSTESLDRVNIFYINFKEILIEKVKENLIRKSKNILTISIKHRYITTPVETTTMKQRLSILFLCTLLSYTFGAIYNLITVDRTLSITPYTTTNSKFIQTCNSICHYDLECRSFDFAMISDSEGVCSFFDVYAYTRTDQSLALTNKTGAKLYSKIPLKDCARLYREGYRKDGLYDIVNPLNHLLTIKIYCSMTLDGGGWTVFQRRFDGSVEFKNRTWLEYKEGFGNPQGEYWLGNEAVHRLTSTEEFDYMVWAKAFDGVTAKRKLLGFRLGNEASGYRFHYQGLASGYEDQPLYANNKGYSNMNGAEFSAFDRGLTVCAASFGGWWHRGCQAYAMNGDYSYNGVPLSHANGIMWVDFRDHYESLKESQLMIRPKWFENEN